MKTNSMATIVTITVDVNASLAKVWESLNNPVHITKWNSGHPDWHTPTASNDLRVGWKLTARMEARDWSQWFDFEGVYTKIEDQKYIAYELWDWRKVEIHLEEDDGVVRITENFEAENVYPVEHQQQWWQHILNNFKDYTESLPL